MAVDKVGQYFGQEVGAPDSKQDFAFPFVKPIDGSDAANEKRNEFSRLVKKCKG